MGLYRSRQEDLAKLAPKYRWIERLLEYQRKTKILNTYVNGIKEGSILELLVPASFSTVHPPVDIHLVLPTSKISREMINALNHVLSLDLTKYSSVRITHNSSLGCLLTFGRYETFGGVQRK